jgi:hypothetical protein
VPNGRTVSRIGSLRKGAIMNRAMKRPLVTAACILALALPAVGLAGNSGDGSEYGTQPGFVVANGNTPCAGHGAFGYFGKDNNLAGGADGYQTGINNSLLCGNRQGNLP